ncbi:MAG: porin family protein [Proteobacteria bacterium]|nr:porin family protein [Pseudomonadota bacterium]
MVELILHAKRAALVALLLTLALVSAPTKAQSDSSTDAMDLLRQAMDAYGNLKFQSAKDSLDKALKLGPKLEAESLARLYAGYGLIMVGGYSDNASGQQRFLIALCLNPNVAVDPLFSTPEIDLLFNMAKKQATPGTCPSILSGIESLGKTPPATDSTNLFPPVISTEAQIAPCGQHNPIVEQKQKYELPVFVEVSPEMSGKATRFVLKYAFDSSLRYNELTLIRKGTGFGNLLSCDQGQIRLLDPSTVSYYIEGMNVSGQVVCGHGTKDAPIQVFMMPDVEPLPPIAGMMPKECAPCPPWDETCGKKQSFLPGFGDPCMPDVGCAEGMYCSDLGICEEDKKEKGGPSAGPSTFYVNVGGGTGFGYESKNASYNATTKDQSQLPVGTTWAYENEDLRLLVEEISNPNGTAWSGIPLRLAFGYFVIPKLSVEVSGRFDFWIVQDEKLQTCWEVGQDPAIDINTIDCSLNERRPEAAKKAVVWNVDGYLMKTMKYQYAWLINARARYRLLSRGSIAISAFGGIGYGHIQFRVPVKDENKAYFPMPGMIDIELGPAFSYFFNDHVGLNVEIPIDIIVGDGFAVNFDLSLGLGFGF